MVVGDGRTLRPGKCWENLYVAALLPLQTSLPLQQQQKLHRELSPCRSNPGCPSAVLSFFTFFCLFLLVRNLILFALEWSIFRTGNQTIPASSLDQLFQVSGGFVVLFNPLFDLKGHHQPNYFPRCWLFPNCRMVG